MSKCVKCGNELLTGDIHWEKGLCNNCYNELLKGNVNFNTNLENMFNAYSKILEEKDQQLAELKAENEKQKKIIVNGNKKLLDFYSEKINKLDNEYNTDLDIRLKENEQLKAENESLKEQYRLAKVEQNYWVDDFNKQLKEKDEEIEHFKKQQLIDMQTIETLQLALNSNTHLVCEKIRELAGDYWDFNICEECGNVSSENVLTMKDFDEILDQIEEGEDK